MKKSRFFTEDKTAYALLLFFFIMLSDAFAVLTGFGGAVVTELMLGSDMMFSTYESLVISSLAICGILLTALYAYRTNQPKKLRAIAATNIIMSLLTIMMNSIYYPFVDMISHTIYRITGIEYFRTSALDHYMSLFVSVPMCIFCFVLLIKLKRGKEEGSDKASFRRTFCVTVTVFASVTASSLAICNILPSEVYNRSGICYIAKQAEAVIDGDMHESRAENIFDSITGETDFSQADALLREDGFIPHTEIKNYIEEQEQYEVLIDNFDELMSDDGTLVYTKPDDGYISYYGGCILLFPDENGKVKKKSITYVANLPEKIEKAEESFKELKIGDEKESVLKKMKKLTDITAVSVEYCGNAVRETYIFSAFRDTSFLSSVCMTWFDGTLVFENGVLTDGKYICANENNFDGEDTDDIIHTEEEYRISE